MQTNEEKQFRLNPQVLIMVAVVLLALALPVAMCFHALQLAVAQPTPDPTTEELGTEPLRQVLEDLATERLAGSGWDSGRMEVVRSADDPEAEQARIEALVRDYEATALPSADRDGTGRLLVSIPREKVGEFLQELGVSKNVVRPPEEQARLWLEIVIKKTESP